ncbi:biotin-dependent carboxyltransferase family protein [Rossellomorea marisflavi]|uniref:5-oxoprolinase subunit C family protein n=1 Tax=Rossellomorea marisflavi TaxID=189381 RepID=UPI00064FE9E1|nr:biotin-dependent carboxyltransferase family protein [Rossellomorea marisflavi]KMK91113.1 KipI antagonist [Rossellomorea marisflavi]
MIEVLKPGLLTTIQDLGRTGFQQYGVSVSGSIDPLAHKVANLLAGNESGAALIEITLTGPHLRFHGQTLLSICGADFSPTINGVPQPLWKPLRVDEGDILRFGTTKEGCRAYLAVAGGIEVPEVMGSHSTYLRAGIGGYRGRALQKGDRLTVGTPSCLAKEMSNELSMNPQTDWSIPYELIGHARSRTIRIMPGNEYGHFQKESREALFNQSYTVSPRSDRMGCRLSGPALQTEAHRDMISEAVTSGTIQVPPDGQPIILLADRQTTGGYPKIAEVASIDLPRIAQAKPGDELRFAPITHEEAQRLYLRRERQLRELRQGISLKYV